MENVIDMTDIEKRIEKELVDQVESMLCSGLMGKLFAFIILYTKHHYFIHIIASTCLLINFDKWK